MRQYFENDLGEVFDFEGQQFSIPSRRVRIDPDDELPVEILQCVGDETVLTQRYDSIVRRENEVRQKSSIDRLQATDAGEHLLRLDQSMMISLIFGR